MTERGRALGNAAVNGIPVEVGPGMSDRLAGGGGFGRESTVDDVLDGMDLSGAGVPCHGLVERAGGGVGPGVVGPRRARRHGGPRPRSRTPRPSSASGPPSPMPTCPSTSSTSPICPAWPGSLSGSPTRWTASTSSSTTPASCAAEKAAPPTASRPSFGTNHLGHFALTLRLMPLLRRAESPRGGEPCPRAGTRIADVDLADPNFEATPYDGWIAYGRSKSANAHFAAELARRCGGPDAVVLGPPGRDRHSARPAPDAGAH